jgi:metallo-beta-lactamase class B
VRHVMTVGAIVALSIATATLAARVEAPDTRDAHVAAARAAAGSDHVAVFNLLCTAAAATPQAAQTGPATAPQPPGPPDRAQWHAEPVKVFDNLYFVGQTEYSAWAVTTSAGIILVDTIFDYSVEDEVVGGLKKLGLDPATIKYAVVSHGHGDHSGGARFLQDHFGTRVILSAADWDLLDRSTGSRPKRDLVATDGQKLTLGDTTLTLYLTPGHTLGTISTLIPVTDGGKPHLVAEWGGTMFNWLRNRTAYITPERPDRFWFDTYSQSARRFRDVVRAAGADVLISNHTIYDGSKTKLPALARRKPGDPHPYVIGADSVQRYLTTVDECAKAGLRRD